MIRGNHCGDIYHETEDYQVYLAILEEAQIHAMGSGTMNKSISTIMIK